MNEPVRCRRRVCILPHDQKLLFVWEEQHTNGETSIVLIGEHRVVCGVVSARTRRLMLLFCLSRSRWQMEAEELLVGLAGTKFCCAASIHNDSTLLIACLYTF